MELQRNINNKNYLFCFITVISCFVFGYILPISIDHVNALTLYDYFNSVYTVITQFGPLVFSLVIIYVINTDYKEKNILFYSSIGYSPIKHFIFKLIPVCLNLSFTLLVTTGVSCIIYKDFSNYLMMFSYYECALLSEVLTASVFAFLFKNILMAFCLNLVIWIGQIILSTSSKVFSILAYYDASNHLYDDLQKYLSSGNKNFVHITQSLIYDFVLFIIVIIIIILFRKRWIKNGV